MTPHEKDFYCTYYKWLIAAWESCDLHERASHNVSSTARGMCGRHSNFNRALYSPGSCRQWLSSSDPLIVLQGLWSFNACRHWESFKKCLIYIFIHSSTRVNSLITQSVNQLFMHSFTSTFMHLFMNAYKHSFIHFISIFIHSSVRSFSHEPTH